MILPPPASGRAAGREVVVLRNRTPHPVTIYDGDRPVASWAPEGPPSRLVESWQPVRSILTDQGPIPLVEVSYTSAVVDLPDPAPGAAVIVSRVLAAAVPRADLLFPADEVRDADGRLIGCRALARFTASASSVQASSEPGPTRWSGESAGA